MTAPPLQRNQSDRDCGHGVECGRCTCPDKGRNFSSAGRKELNWKPRCGGRAGQPASNWSHCTHSAPSHAPQLPEPAKNTSTSETPRLREVSRPLTIHDHEPRSELGYKWSPAGGHMEPVLLGAVGLQSGTLPVGWDAAHANSCRLRASPYR